MKNAPSLATWRNFVGKGNPILGDLRLGHHLSGTGLSPRGTAALHFADLLPFCRMAKQSKANHQHWPSPQLGTTALHFTNIFPSCRTAEHQITDKVKEEQILPVSLSIQPPKEHIACRAVTSISIATDNK